jgi:PAS domain S-box-containing protein
MTPDEMVGKHLAAVMGPEAYETIRPYVDRVLAGERVEYKAVPYRAIGRRFMPCAYVPQRDSAGEVAGWVAVITDITERKEAEDKLGASEQRFQTLTCGVASALRAAEIGFAEG